MTLPTSKAAIGATVNTAHFYSPLEERINVVSHACGLALSVVGAVFLVHKAITQGTAVHTVSFAVFGSSLIALYLASTLYHSANDANARTQLRTLDHASIYLLIAGTYTPFALIILQGTVGWIIFSVAWAMATIGIIVKVFFTGRYNHLSTVMYVLMGWLIVFAIKPLIANFSTDGLGWLFAGGISYTVGALFYSIRRMPFGHATFHIFVLGGSLCHFVAVYWFVLPAVARTD